MSKFDFILIWIKWLIIHAHHAAVILSRIPAFWKSMNSHFRLLRDLIPWRHSWCTWCFNLLMDSKRKFYCKKHLQILNVNLKSIMAGNLHASLWKIFSILSFPSDFTCNLTTSSNKNTTDDRKLVRNMTNNGIILEQLQQRDHILFGSVTFRLLSNKMKNNVFVNMVATNNTSNHVGLHFCINNF